MKRFLSLLLLVCTSCIHADIINDGEFDLISSVIPPFNKPNDVVVVGNYAYGVSEESPSFGGFWVIDISDENNPVVAGSDGSVFWGYELVVRGDYSFTAGNEGRFDIVDLADPTAAAVKISQLTIGDQLFAVDALADGSRAYVANSAGNQGIVAIDTSDKQNPSVLGNYGGFNAGSVRIDESRNLGFVTDYPNKKLIAVDISNPTPTFLSEVSVTTSDFLVWLELDNERQIAYAGDYFGKKVHVIDVSDANNVTKITEITVPGDIFSMKIDQGVLYVANTEGVSGNVVTYLDIYDICMPQNPLHIRRWQANEPGDGSIDGFWVDSAKRRLYLPSRRANSESGRLDIVNMDGFIAPEFGLLTTDHTRINAAFIKELLKLPNLTTSERDALPALNGLLIYNTDTNKLQGYENGSWRNL